MLRTPDASSTTTPGARSVLLWLLVATAVVAGIVLYFRHERTLTPLIG